MLQHLSGFPSFLWLNNIHLWMDPILCNYAFINAHGECFHLLAVGKNVATNIAVHIWFRSLLPILWGIYSEVELLNHTVILG